MQLLKTVLHVHTNYSHDSNVSPEQLVDAAIREGVDCVGVTDHDSIRGALEAKAIAGDRVRIIVGEEISTADGHVIGLFLFDRITPGLSAEETARRIRAQGGVVLVPHPFVTFCEFSMNRALHRFASHVDAVEVHNAQHPIFWQDGRAARFVRENGLTPYVGVDSHVRGTRWPAWQLIPPFESPDEFLASLRQARFVRGRYGVSYLAQMTLRHFYEQWFKRPFGDYGVNNDYRKFVRGGRVIPERVASVD